MKKGGVVKFKIWILGLIMVLALAANIKAEQCNETLAPCGGGCNTTDMTDMFNSVINFDTVIGNITGWNTSCITNMRSMFLGSDFNQSIGSWDVSNVTIMEGMFNGDSVFNQNLSAWNTSSVILMGVMFKDSSVFDGDIAIWDTGKVTDMAYMFSGALAFNQDISGWDTGKVTDMRAMFQFDTLFNQDISGWEVGNVTLMDDMFAVCQSFNQDISGWDVSQVTSMTNMFRDCFAFNQPIGIWNTSSVTNMRSMFIDANIFNQDLSGWDVSHVTNMKTMFGGTLAFDQDLSLWNTSQVTAMGSMFLGAGLSTPNYDNLLLGWGNQVQQLSVTFDAGSSIYSPTGVSGRNILTGTYLWTIYDGGSNCTPDWNCTGYSVCQFDNLIHCNNVSDNNYCGELYYGDYSEFTPQNCTFLVHDFILQCDPQPIIYPRIDCLVFMNDTENYQCWTMVRQQGLNGTNPGNYLQVNPSKLEYSQGIIARVSEDREYFSIINGAGNVYYTDKSIVGGTPYLVAVKCVSDINGTVKMAEMAIMPGYENLNTLPARSVWAKTNVKSLIGYFFLIALALGLCVLGYIAFVERGRG
jgi:surface protein